jgi:signal peptidase II
MNPDHAPTVAPTTDSQGETDGNAPAAPSSEAQGAAVRRPSLVLLAAVTTLSLAADLVTKWWALARLERVLPNGDTVATPIVVNSWLTFLLARNRGGAWGLLQTASESVRRPFFLLISAAAIAFIVYLYRRVHPRQHALKWGLPLVLGGAIGNLVDRIRYGWVVDFIDYRAGWVEGMNKIFAKLSPGHGVTDHWPTFNVADIAICIGVGLMAVDMFTSRRDGTRATEPARPEATSSPGADPPAS